MEANVTSDAIGDAIFARGFVEGKKAGIKEGVQLDRALTEHILQDGNENWSIESWRIKAWLRDRQALPEGKGGIKMPEAKDTVLKENPFNSNSDEQAERICWSAYEQGKQAQAEISFKAGIKEVVEWIDNTDVGNKLYVQINRDHWDKFKGQDIRSREDAEVAEARKEVATDIGQMLCVLAGNLMLEERDAGDLLARQLQPIMDYLKTKYLPDLPRLATVETIINQQVSEAKVAGIKEVLEWIKDRIFYCADSPPQEGVAYGYLGNYILKFGKEVLPSVGFYELSESSDWQAKLKEWGIEK